MYTLPEPAQGDPLQLERALKLLLDEFLKVRDERLEKGLSLSGQDRAWLCIFAAAAHSRTVEFRERTSQLWSHMATLVKDMAKGEPRVSRDIPIKFEKSDGVQTTISLADIEDLAAFPVQRLLPSAIARVGHMLARKPLRILRTAETPGFITSDAPVGVFNPETVSGSPESPDTEVTLPLTPRHMVMWKNWPEGYSDPYIDIPTEGMAGVDQLNRRTYLYSHKRIVVQKNVMKDWWFPPP